MRVAETCISTMQVQTTLRFWQEAETSVHRHINPLDRTNLTEDDSSLVHSENSSD